MNESFLRLKNNFLTAGIIKSLMAAMSAGFFSSGALLLLADLKIIELKVTVIVLIASAAFVAAGAVTYLLLHKSDRRLARNLDREYGLEERLETMLQYREESGAIYQLQRQDAGGALDAQASGKTAFKYLWIFGVSLLVSISLFVVSLLLIPEPTPPEEEPDTPFKLTAIQESALIELIDYIESSTMSSPYKESTALHVEILLDELKATNTVKGRDAAILKANAAILKETDDSSFALEIINNLGAADTAAAKLFALAINYYGWTLGDEWDSYTDAMTNVRTRLISVKEVETDALAEVSATLTKLGYDVSLALLSSGTPETDGLHKILTAYVALDTTNDKNERVLGMTEISAAIANMSYSAAQNALDALFTHNNTDLFLALEQESIDTGTGEYAVTRICEIFDTALPRFERPSISKNVEEDDENNSSSEDTGGGGIGVGTVYGSDDLVLDPYTEELVEYGTIIDRYYSEMFGKNQNGDYTDEEKKAMEKYFEILYGGFDKEDN